MSWRFTIVNSEGIETVIDDPKGWDDIEVNIERDPDSHGIFFNYPIQTLEFHDEGALLIKSEYDVHGVNGNMSLKIEFQCSDGESYELFYFGRMAFDGYKDECGDLCTVIIGLEDMDDIMLMRNNFEQKVNLYNNISFDETTTLTDYTNLNTTLQLPPRGLVQKSDALSSAPLETRFFTEFPEQWGHLSNPGFGFEAGSFPIAFSQSDVGNTEIGVDGTQFSQGVFYYSGGDPGDNLELLQIPGNSSENLACYPKDFRVIIHASGTLQWIAFGDTEYKLRISVRAGLNKNDTRKLAEVEGINLIDVSNGSAPYNIDIDSFVLLNPGELLWIYYYVDVTKVQPGGGGFVTELIHTQDSGTFIKLTQTSVCIGTDSKVSYINEAISRTIESITNDKIRFYSTFFGRPDSQPYAIPNETCGGAFSITNGLNIRRKILADNTQPGFFVTLKDLFDSLKAIWNIGFEIEPDLNRPGFNRLRFEDWRYFYQDEIGLRFQYATSIKRAVDTARLYNRMIVGFNKWEAGEFTGLDEFMTQRTYRININAISKELNVSTDMICSPYTIEITRRQDSGTQDWQYDNDIFGFCLIRDGSGYRVELFTDSAYGVQNINDPDSNYNGRVSPARNAMRWFNFIMQGYRVFSDDSRLIFSSGTGNYIAEFGLNNCNIEGDVLSESENIDIGDFEDQQNAKPPLFPEILTFDHPMNYNTFLKLKNDPTLKRKSIVIVCNETETPAWIKSIKYRPNDGEATIEAYPKNTTQIPEPTGCQATIVPGSVTLTDYDSDTNTALIDFTEGNPGATTWHFIVTEGPTPGVGTGYSGITSSHPFLITGISPGQWSIFIVPYCDEDTVGQNYGSGTFDIPFPPFQLELTGYLTTGRGGQNRLVLTARSTNNTPAPVGFNFKWGNCARNTSIGVTYCTSYPGSPVPTPENMMVFFAGETEHTQESAQVTPGANFGYIEKVVLFGLTGITSSQIVKAPGQAWTLEFI